MTDAGETPGKRVGAPPERSAASPPTGPRPAAPAAGTPQPGAVRRAKRLVTIVFLTAVVGWVGFAAAQIIRIVLFPAVAASPYPTCGAGLRALGDALERGRVASHAEEDADRGLLAFRASVDPAWKDLEGVRGTCRSAAELRGLDAVERLRYAEEQAVRREAGSLALNRQQAEAAIAELDPPGPAPRPLTSSSSDASSTRDPWSRREREAPPAPTSAP